MVDVRLLEVKCLRCGNRKQVPWSFGRCVLITEVPCNIYVLHWALTSTRSIRANDPTERWSEFPVFTIEVKLSGSHQC